MGPTKKLSLSPTGGVKHRHVRLVIDKLCVDACCRLRCYRSSDTLPILKCTPNQRGFKSCAVMILVRVYCYLETNFKFVPEPFCFPGERGMEREKIGWRGMRHVAMKSRSTPAGAGGVRSSDQHRTGHAAFLSPVPYARTPEAVSDIRCQNEASQLQGLRCPVDDDCLVVALKIHRSNATF